jgi:CIC family chloride channel protein
VSGRLNGVSSPHTSSRTLEWIPSARSLEASRPAAVAAKEFDLNVLGLGVAEVRVLDALDAQLRGQLSQRSAAPGGGDYEFRRDKIQKTVRAAHQYSLAREADSLKERLRQTWKALFATHAKSSVGRRWLLLDTLLLGVIGALSAQLFALMLRATQDLFLTRLAGYQPPGLPNEGGVLQPVIGPYGLWLIPAVTTLGGLIAGLLVYSLAPEAEGHGTDTAVKAYHQAGGIIRARIAPLKMIASAITIGSGGTAGREGPTALITAGIGSLYASLTHRSESDRRLLVLIGMASGLAAIFRSPIGTALFAVEVLYSGMEFEGGALVYTMLGAVVAYAVNGLFVGYKPLFRVQLTSTPQFFDYPWYIGLGLAAGLVATALPMVFYSIRDLFRAIPIAPHFKPAIGGLALGLLALALPQVLGGGYAYIQEAINGQLSAQLMFALIFGEMLALSVTISSGGSGGVFAPSLFIGAMLGSLLAQVFNQTPAALTIVGMAAVFGGAARVPIATLFMVTEMTGDYALLVPAALAIMLSYLIQSALSARLKYPSLYEAQVPFRLDSPAHYAENLEAILKLLNERKVSLPATVTHLHVRTLLASGVPVDLPGDRQMVIGILRADSRYAGKPIETYFNLNQEDEVEIVAVFRQGRTIVPQTGLVLRAGDRLLAIASQAGRAQLAHELAPLSEAQVIGGYADSESGADR